MCGSDESARGPITGHWPTDAFGVPQPPPLIEPSHISNGKADTPDTGLKDLKKYHSSDANVRRSLLLEDFSNVKFIDTYLKVGAVDEDVAPGMAQGWTLVGERISTAKKTFKAELGKLEGWKGETQKAAMQNVNSTYHIPETLTAGSDILGRLAHAFSATMRTTRNDISANFTNYLHDLSNRPEKVDQIEHQYNSFAKAVMTQAYEPNILDISQSHPALNTGSPAQVGGPTGGPAFGGGAGELAAFGGGAGGLGPVGGASTLPNPNFAVPTSMPTPPQVPITPQVPINPAAAMASPMSGLQGLQGLSGLANPLQSALGQAMSAAQQAGRAGAPGGLNGPRGKPPEGVLGLGPKGLKGGGGAAGGGAGLRGVSAGKPAGAPATAAGTTAGRTVAAGSRAGLSSTPGTAAAGAPGAGAPGAGQHGAGAQGTPHQPSKALRRKKNGEDLIGATDAVVAVLGEPARAEAAKPDAT